MSKLIDSELKLRHRDTCEIGGLWYAAKPMEYFTVALLWRRAKDCCRILRGRSFAVHYKIDEVR